ncbi:hypothetical protein ASC94_01190 [Massilia sp. Root418]|uniref:hypothetical protein n=1 Tax=Massilia sp. Root418 TaxID=1736532 RepID=UPI0006FDC282|nr:hypothetical protein [Massilia sp. Root418]KQX01291.1 hypothetical protein ASC94_01190 [Massilia sp. Root418]
MTVTTKLLALPATLLCAGACAAAPDAIDPAKLSEKDVTLQEVPSGKPQGKAFLAATIINAPMARLCGIIQDYAGYPGFMPSVSHTALSKSASGSPLVDMTLKLPLGKVKKYRLEMTPKVSPQQCRLAWDMVPNAALKNEETIAGTDGFWQLAPVAGDSGKTVVQYYVYTDPGPVPMGAGWIVDSMSKDSLPKTLEALRARALR